MLERSDLIYQYDGSYDGFLCCVFESFYQKEDPADIILEDEEQATLFSIKWIETEPVKAERVQRSIPLKISHEAQEWLQRAFLSCMPQKEVKMLAFLRLGYRIGAKVTKLSTHDAVLPLEKAILSINREAHSFIEFLRFSDLGDFLAAEIMPKNQVFPIIVPHFSDRFPDENFVIYDKTHQLAFVHHADGSAEFLQGRLQFPDPDQEEENYRRLWRHFYETIAIESRQNERGRLTHLAKRYRPDMTEFQR